MATKLYVGNLNYATNDSTLQSLFSEAGQVTSCQVMTDRYTGESRGFAFVEMATEADSQNAVAQLHDREFGGRRLAVNEARPPAPRSGGFGGGGGDRGGFRKRSEPRW